MLWLAAATVAFAAAKCAGGGKLGCLGGLGGLVCGPAPNARLPVGFELPVAPVELMVFAGLPPTGLPPIGPAAAPVALLTWGAFAALLEEALPTVEPAASTCLAYLGCLALAWSGYGSGLLSSQAS